MKLPKLAHKGWSDCDAFTVLPQIAKQLKPGSYVPNPSEWAFRAFEMNPLDIQVIIVDESPYAGQYASGKSESTGYALATDNDNYREWPLSLKVIYQSILTHEEGSMMPQLASWRNQGVFLLNASLTCLQNLPGSHNKLWVEFTSKLVAYISSLPGTRIWYFLGETAKLERHIAPFKDLVFKSEHPSLATYEKPFDGYFKQISEKTEELYGTRIKYLHTSPTN